MLRKSRLRQKNGFLLKNKRVFSLINPIKWLCLLNQITLIFLHYLCLVFLKHVPLFLCHCCMLLHVILCLILLAYHLRILLILLMNFFLWFLVFYEVSFVLNQMHISSRSFCLILFLVFQQNLIIVLLLILSCRLNLYLHK